MAITKILPVKGYLRDCLRYVANPEKTNEVTVPHLENLLEYAQGENKLGRRQLVVGVNCDPLTVYYAMQATKRRWGKNSANHVAGYHIIQSFKPGEVTPEQCFEIGCEFAKRYLAERYECIVSTHVDKEHLHCHIVFNSVSFMDGKMFRSNFDAYYNGIRKVSDELCRQYGLSVVETDGVGVRHSVIATENEERPTIRKMIQTDIETAMKQSQSWEAFLSELRGMGYEIKLSSAKRKYTTVRPKYGKRSIRLASLESRYHEQSIKNYFAERRVQHLSEKENEKIYLPEPNLKRYYARFKGSLSVCKRHYIGGFMALHYHYRRLLSHTKKGKVSKRYVYLLWDDLQKFERYKKQCEFIWSHRIETKEDLQQAKRQAEQQIESLFAERKRLYYLRGKYSGGYNQEDLSVQIKNLSIQLKQQKQIMQLCGYIEADAQHICEQLDEVRQIELQERKERERNESRIRCR